MTITVPQTMSTPPQIRLAVDIGGTFTDVALATSHDLHTAKTLTTPRAPAEGVFTAVAQVLSAARLEAKAVDVIIHGTTLATNAIIERQGARTALLVTEGFRDSVEMAYENRFEQYDINMQKPAPLVPRHLRIPVRERISARGEVLQGLDESSLDSAIEHLRTAEVESVAICLLHCYANPAHEQRIKARLEESLPEAWLTLSSEVCPEIREYERLSTACANAYVQPLMSRYLESLESGLKARGFACPMLLMTSGGGLTTVATARRHPIRLVESGPAGGAILAAGIAKARGLHKVLSFDMGGTTAKICLIDHSQPQTSRTFEVDRMYRFTKGSGLPLRIPVIEMVEIGAGGGSIGSIDAVGRVQVGPHSAGSEPGPACYGLGGTAPTVTDADLLLGRLDAEAFAGGTLRLDPESAQDAVVRDLASPMGLEPVQGAVALSEMVGENMANAARVHAVERGSDTATRTLIAFGGAAPLHAARVAEKLGIHTVIVPSHAGVGSAIGFLQAPVSYEVVRSHYTRLSELETSAINALLTDMQQEGQRLVRLGVPEEIHLEVRRYAYMRYVGQGHEVEVTIPARTLEAADKEFLQSAFDRAYESLYARTIPDMDVEIMTWAVAVSEPAPPISTPPPVETGELVHTGTERELFDMNKQSFARVGVYQRRDLAPGDRITGPALIVEDQTTTVVSARFNAELDGEGFITLHYQAANEP